MHSFSPGFINTNPLGDFVEPGLGGYIDIGDGCWRSNVLVTTFDDGFRDVDDRFRGW